MEVTDAPCQLPDLKPTVNIDIPDSVKTHLAILKRVQAKVGESKNRRQRFFSPEKLHRKLNSTTFMVFKSKPIQHRPSSN